MDRRGNRENRGGASPNQRFIRRAVSTSGGFASPPVTSRQTLSHVSLSAEKPSRIPMQSIRRQNSIDRSRNREDTNALLINDNQCIYQVHNNSISPLYIEHEKNIMLNSHCGYVHCCLSRLEIIFWHGGRCTDRDIALTSRLSECLAVVESLKRQMNIVSRRFRSVADFCKKLSLYPSSVTIDEIPPHAASARIDVYSFTDTSTGFHALHQAIKPPISPSVLSNSHVTAIIYRKFVWLWVGRTPSAALLVRPALAALSSLLNKLDRSEAKVLLVRHHSEPVAFQCLFDQVTVEGLILRCKGGETLCSVTEGTYNEEESRDNISASDIDVPVPPSVNVSDLDPSDPVLMTVAQKRVFYMQRAQSLGGIATGVVTRGKKASTDMDDTSTEKTRISIAKHDAENADTNASRRLTLETSLPTVGEEEADDSQSFSENRSMPDPMESSISAASNDDLSVDGVIVNDFRADSDEETSIVTDNAVMLVENNETSLVEAFFDQDQEDTEKDEAASEVDTPYNSKERDKKFIPELAMSTSTVGEHEVRELKHMESLAVHRKSLPRKSAKQQEAVGMGCRCSIM